MRFLLINPSRTVERHNIWSVINSVTPPVGLAVLAAVLEQQGTPTDIIDAQALQLTPEEVVERASAHGDYDIIGITATTPEIQSASVTAQLLRTAYPEARILFGGVHPTIFHRELVEGGVADFVIRGEGEEPIVALAANSPLSDIASLTWRSEAGDVIVNPLTEKRADLNSLPLPAYDKLPMDRYRSALGAARRSPSLGIITSRGCPGSCTFCYSGMFGKQIRYVSADLIHDHIVFLKKHYGIKEISFYDDTFTSDRERVITLCNLMIREKSALSWSCFARVDTVDQELLLLMRRAGCHQIMYGFESSDDKVLKTINKRVTTGSYDEVIKITRAAGIDIRGAFMLGSPEETEQSLVDTIDFSTRLDIQYAIFNITTPYPGTALHVWATKHNCLIHSDWEKYDLAHPIMELPGLPSKIVEMQYRRAYKVFYLRPAYIFGRLFGMLSPALFKTGWEVFKGIILMPGKKNVKTGH